MSDEQASGVEHDDGVEREYVVYECGHRCWDAGIGGAPSRCSRDGSPVDERRTTEVDRDV